VPTRRGVISVIPEDLDNGETRHTFRVEEAFGAVVKARTRELTCKPTDSEFLAMGATPSPDAVLKAGQKLFGVLSGSVGVQNLFAQMDMGLNPVIPAGTPDTYPLFVKIDDDPDAEGLPWEVLWEKGRNFLCLDPRGRWPVARMASGTTRSQPVYRTIEPVLKVALVLAAVGESGAVEWDRFQRAVAGLGVPVQVLVLVSEEAALQQIKADLDQWLPARGSGNVDFVGDPKSLMEQILAFYPNVLHFFCHGVTDVSPELELETRADRRSKKPKERGSIKLDAKLLADIVNLRSLWLIVLNCCRGGKPAPNLHSMAKTLVTDGVPAVVAMRESIDVSDANLFTEYFYTSLLKQLDQVYAIRAATAAAKTPIPFPELAWMRATDNARRELSRALGRAAATDSQWTYPVLYVHRDELNLEHRDLTAPKLTAEERTEITVQLEIVRRMVDTMRSGIDAETDAKRHQLESRIHELEARLVS
jgi:hypothetical protein